MTRTAASSSKSIPIRPYNRPPNTVKGKGKAPTHHEDTGAPSQTSQTSRKGKKAWRKNVDISAEEQALERAREEERLTGGKYSEKKNNDLFIIDTVGDADVSHRLRRASRPLRSLSILDERSAIPSLTSKPAATSSKTEVSRTEKLRLRKMARKALAGSDGSGIKAAHLARARTERIKDVWEDVEGRRAEGGFAQEVMAKREVKAPLSLKRQREIYLSSQVEMGRAVELPDGGVSYNPPAERYQRLIDMAVEEEKARLRREEEGEQRVALLAAAMTATRQPLRGEEYADGMEVGPGEVELSEPEDSAVTPSKLKKRKTQAQRNKALRLKEEARQGAQDTRRKKLLRSVGTLPSLEAALRKKAKRDADEEQLRILARKERETLGLKGGEKIGKHRVKKEAVTVQLGEDLAETLRQIKPEGNLFKDRFVALQKRGLVEPRVPQQRQRKLHRTKEYEKHAYKRFT